MTHEQALHWLDTQADNLQRAGVKIRLVSYLHARNDMADMTETERSAVIENAMIAAVEAETRGDAL